MNRALILHSSLLFSLFCWQEFFFCVPLCMKDERNFLGPFVTGHPIILAKWQYKSTCLLYVFFHASSKFFMFSKHFPYLWLCQYYLPIFSCFPIFFHIFGYGLHFLMGCCDSHCECCFFLFGLHCLENHGAILH